jgi:carboxymethylenebutenolidase
MSITTAPIAIETARVPVDDGTQMVVHVAKPMPGTANGGGILVFQEAFGVNDYILAVTARFASLGLVAVSPEFFHRSGDGKTASYDSPPAVRHAFTKVLTKEGLASDVRATYAWLREAGLGVDARRVAAVGFCMGGRTAYLANAEAPLAAAISFYGGRITVWFDSIPAQHGPLLMFWGAKDEQIPLAQQREVADAFSAAKLLHTEVVFSEAGHGFFRHTRSDVYEPRAAGQAWALTVEFLQQNGVLPAP